MNLDRRDFIKTALAASAAASAMGGLKASAATTPSNSVGAEREYYELRAYRMKADAPHTLLDGYLEKALIPALNRRGVQKHRSVHGTGGERRTCSLGFNCTSLLGISGSGDGGD